MGAKPSGIKTGLRRIAARIAKRESTTIAYILQCACSRHGHLGVRLLRDEVIYQLREGPYSYHEIACALNWPVKILRVRISKMIKKGQCLPRGRATYNELYSARVQIIIQLMKRRATLQEIGSALGGLTHERARQLISQISKKHGPEVFTPDQPLRTTKEAGAELGISPASIQVMCQRGEVPCRRRGCQKNGYYLIDAEAMKALRQHPNVTKKKICIVCQAEFLIGPKQSAKDTCSIDCQQQRKQQMRAMRLTTTPSLGSLVTWHRKVWKKLRVHKRPKREEWLTEAKATRRTELSKMQLRYLRMRRIVTIRRHRSKRWRGKPVALYAASELDIVRKIHQRWQYGQEKKS